MRARLINVASAASEIFRGGGEMRRRPEPNRAERAASRRVASGRVVRRRSSQIVGTSSMQRRINLEVEVTALSRRVATRRPGRRRRPAKARSICRRRAADLPSSLPATPPTPPPPEKKVRGESAETTDAHSANTPGDRKRNGITYGGSDGARNGRVLQRREPFG